MGYNISVSLTHDLIPGWEAVPKFERSKLVQRLLREEFSGSTTKVKKKVNKLVINSKAVEKVDKRNPDITAVISYWLEHTPFKIASKDMAMNRNNVSTLLRKYSLKDIETLIRTTMAAHTDQFASKEQKAKSLIELQMNANAIVSYGMMKQKEINEGEGNRVKI